MIVDKGNTMPVAGTDQSKYDSGSTLKSIESLRNIMGQIRSQNEAGGVKSLVNFEGSAQQMMMGIISNDWDNMDTHQLIFCQNLSENVNQMEASYQHHQSSLTHTYPDILHTKVGCFILSQVRAGDIDPNWCLLNN